jgi:cell division septation protein DedD
MNTQENKINNTVTAEPISNDYSPLDSRVKQRDYTSHKVDNAEPLPELEEPVFEAPNFDAYEDVQESSAGDSNEPERVFNETYSELSGKEKTLGAEMMAEMALDMYEKGCGLLGKLPEISESKLDRLIAEGEINPSITLQTEDGAVPIKQFAEGYNESMKTAFGVSDEFKENIKPPLIRIFKKRGIGMTDEQLVGYYLLTDLGTKGVQAVMLRKTTNSILDQLKQNTLAIKEQSAPKTKTVEPTPPPAFTSTPTPPPVTPSPEKKSSKSEEYTENISEAVIMSKPKSTSNNKRRPLTHLDEQINNFTEPEENGVYANLRDIEGFKHEYVEPTGMPQFGDKDILAKMEELAKNPEKPVRKSSKTSVSKGVSKPRNTRK